MDYIKCFQGSIDYIEKNLKEILTVEELAEHAGFSPYHYYRLFNSYVGMPVMQYIRRRRMAYAVNDLYNNKRIIDIAMDYGFDTHSGFSKAFRKEYGCSPTRYLIHANVSIPKKINLKLQKKYNLNGGVIMEPRIITKPTFKVVGYEIKTSLESKQSEREIPAFWDRFEIDGLEEILYKTIKPKEHGEYAIWFPPNMETGEFVYVLGVKTDTFENAPKDMFKAEIPEATYAVFTTPPAAYENRGFVKAIQGTWEYILNEWFPDSGYEIAPNRPDFEFYDERCHGETNVVMDIYIPIVKKG